MQTEALNVNWLLNAGVQALTCKIRLAFSQTACILMITAFNVTKDNELIGYGNFSQIRFVSFLNGFLITTMEVLVNGNFCCFFFH